MFTLQEQRKGVYRKVQLGEVCEIGLGIVVTQSPRFDPTRMKERFGHWLNVVVDEIAKQAREEISKTFKVNEDPVGRKVLYRKAIRSMTPITSSALGITWASETFKTPSQAMQYIKMIGMGALTWALPWVGAILTLTSLFGKKKKTMAMPWGTIFTNAVPYARQMTEQEEYARIMAEGIQIEQERRVEVKKQSERATQFKLPEGVTSISKGGVLKVQPKGGPVEVRK